MLTAEKLMSMIVVGVMGNSVIYLIPLLVGAMVSDRGFSEQQAGFMASADLAGYAVATFGAALVLDRFSWRRMGLLGVAIMVVANISTTFLYRHELFAAIRFVSGLGGGLLAALATVSLGQTENPDRNYGLLFAAQLLFATGGLWGFPPLLDRFTLNSAYWLIALLALLVGFAAASLPQGRAERVQSRADAMRGRWLLAPAVLASILLFFAEQNAIWAYIERIGNGAGLSAHYIGFSLGVATLTGFAGAALVAWAGTRVGRLIPLALATLLQLGCLVTLVGHAAPAAYLFSTAVLALSWNVVNPFQLGILAEVDPSGKALALAATVTGVGMAAGPAVAAFTIDGDGYTAILWLAGVLAVVSLVLVLPALQTIRRTVMGS